MENRITNEIEFFAEDNEKTVYNRALARDIVFRYVFEYEVLGDEVLQRLESVEGLPFQMRDKTYIINSVRGIAERIETIDAMIAKYSDKWDIRRLSKVAMAAIRVGVYEMEYIEDIPARVTLNECINLAKKYDVPASGKFVNGILANLYQRTEESKEEQ